ncbi:hypothetical protein [Microbacterium hatanonis]|uniref:hypothetical protein n=1 Tax=Microbacterium hatanonis TaxID=404366 RepID=UPI00164F335D|nr:hypothetical protein [Microbacterium hatanonis]
MDRRSFTIPAPIGPADLALPPTQPVNITGALTAAISPVPPDARSRASEITEPLGRVTS